jgi:small subunit ribosomal protein S17
MSEVDTAKRGSRKQRDGEVVGRSGDKTAVVMVQRRTQHPLYGKTMRKRKKYHVHDENNELKQGDKVRIVETRPISRSKRWRVARVIEKS